MAVVFRSKWRCGRFGAIGFVGAGVFVVHASLAVNAFAAPIVYTSYADFVSATGAVSATGPLPNTGSQGGGPVTYGSVTYTTLSSTLWFQDWTSLLSGNELAISDKESFAMDLAAPVGALGFYWVDPVVTTSFTARLLFEGNVLEAVSFAAAQASARLFFGVQNDALFDRVEILESTNDIANEYFGEVFTGTTLVPEPSWVALWGCAFAATLLRFSGETRAVG